MGFCELTGKTILVTGASSGIGRQAAISIAKQGGNVVITGRNEERLEETMQALEGNNHLSIVADLTKEKDVDKLVEALPQLNGLVHSAGIVVATPVKFIRQEDISKAFERTFARDGKDPDFPFDRQRYADFAKMIWPSWLTSCRPAQ